MDSTFPGVNPADDLVWSPKATYRSKKTLKKAQGVIHVVRRLTQRETTDIFTARLVGPETRGVDAAMMGSPC